MPPYRLLPDCRPLTLRSLGVAFLILISAILARADTLPANVASALKAAGIPPGATGILVADADTARPYLSVNGSQPMNPASVMKLVTTYAALDLLGPSATWTTTLAATTQPGDDGTLNGNLYLQGSGDPKLTLERFWLLLHQLRDRGVRSIHGDLILDRTAFAAIAETSAAFDDQPMRPYNVTPDALLLNFKALHLTLRPAADHVDVSSEPQPDNLDIVNLIKPSAATCGEWKDGLRSDIVAREPRYRLVLSGSYPGSCGEKVWHLAALPHDRYVLGVFRQLWRELGGEFDGSVRDGIAPTAMAVSVSSESPTLMELVRDINKFSNNVMARQLFLSLANTRPADSDAAARRVNEWLGAKNLSMPELVLDNGSGLSRRERISANSLGALLQSAYASPLMPEFVSSLPLTGVDGTMKKRLYGSNVSGQGHIKTGTLEGVKTIAGYLRNAAGKTVLVVFLVNHPNAAKAQAAQDALLQWAYESTSGTIDRKSSPRPWREPSH